jgi:hypothetical protein
MRGERSNRELYRDKKVDNIFHQYECINVINKSNCNCNVMISQRVFRIGISSARCFVALFELLHYTVVYNLQ